MDKQYSYPLDLTWSTEEISSVLSFFNQVEQAYEKGVEASQVLAAYAIFKQVVKGKGEERRLDREFQAVSGYSTYRVVKEAQTKQKGRIHLGS